MKTYIVYVKGIEVGYTKARSRKLAEKKAAKEHKVEPRHVDVVYTEV